MEIIGVAALGAIIGSFLSVCIYRIPLGREDLEDQGQKDAEPKSETPITISNPPRSFCPACKAQLAWYHNVPVLSWLLLGGRCGFCKKKISVRYPVVELLSAFFAVLSVTLWGFSPTAAVIYIFCATLIVISFIDIDYYIIPNVISLPGTVLGLAIAVVNQYTEFFAHPVSSGIKESLLGIAAGAGFLFLVSEIYLRLRKVEGLGMGDVKLLAMTGALFGPECALYTIFVGSLVGSVIGLTLVLFGGRRMSHALPFGPYLAVGTLLYLFTDIVLLQMIGEFFAPSAHGGL